MHLFLAGLMALISVGSAFAGQYDADKFVPEFCGNNQQAVFPRSAVSQVFKGYYLDASGKRTEAFFLKRSDQGSNVFLVTQVERNPYDAYYLTVQTPAQLDGWLFQTFEANIDASGIYTAAHGATDDGHSFAVKLRPARSLSDSCQ